MNPVLVLQTNLDEVGGVENHFIIENFSIYILHTLLSFILSSSVKD